MGWGFSQALTLEPHSGHEFQRRELSDGRGESGGPASFLIVAREVARIRESAIDALTAVPNACYLGAAFLQ
jgi:hypothetical protein